MSEAIARRLRVYGKVQGVFFRAWTVEKAVALGLDGWVRNRNDGTVEIVAVGPAAAVEALIGVCHQGPGEAQVIRIDVEQTPGIVGKGFVQKPTV